MVASFQAECARLQKGVILEKCRTLLLQSGPSDPNWRWAADFVARYGEAATPTTSIVKATMQDERPIEALPLSERIRAVRSMLTDSKN